DRNPDSGSSPGIVTIPAYEMTRQFTSFNVATASGLNRVTVNVTGPTGTVNMPADGGATIAGRLNLTPPEAAVRIVAGKPPFSETATGSITAASSAEVHLIGSPPPMAPPPPDGNEEVPPPQLSWNISGLVRAGKLIPNALGTTPIEIDLEVPTGRIEGLLVIKPFPLFVTVNVGDKAYVGGIELGDGPNVVRISQVRPGLSVLQGEMMFSANTSETNIVGGTINGIITGTIATEGSFLGIQSSVGPAAALGNVTVREAMLLDIAQGDLRLLKGARIESSSV